MKCKYCGEKLVLKNRITDRDWSKQKSYYWAHENNKQCQTQHGVKYYPSKESAFKGILEQDFGFVLIDTAISGKEE